MEYLCIRKRLKLMIQTNKLFLAALSTLLSIDTFANGHVATELSDTSRIYDLDEIVIVSQPKETAQLRRQPVSSSMFADNDMARLGISDMNDLALYIPSLNIPRYGSRLTSSIYVRGIGSRTGDPAVGVYYDNIPLVSKSAYNTHFYQLDRVDFLRGPQGTLYGMNSEGGLMRVYSKNPMTHQGTDIHVGMAMGGGSNVVDDGLHRGLSTNIEVSHYHRPTDNFAFSIAAFYSGDKGFFPNSNIPSEAADLSNEAGARAHFMWNASDRLSFELTSDYQYVNQNAFPYGEYDATNDEWHDPATTILNGYKRQLLTNGLHIAYRMPSFQLSSTTSYQFLDDLMTMDQDYIPADFMRLQQEQKMHAVTQEFVLKTISTSRWQHTSGIFASHQWLKTNAPVYFGEDMNMNIKDKMGMPPMIANSLILDNNEVLGSFQTPRLNLAAYHESNVSLTDRLMLTLGLRYEYQQTEIDYDTEAHFRLAYSGMMAGRPMNIDSRFASQIQSSSSDKYHQLLPKAALSYRFDNNNSNVYATVSKGFRAGGYNIQMFSDIFKSEQSSLGQQFMQLMQGDMSLEHTADDYANINNTITYEPEVCWNYEVGTHLNAPTLGIKLDASAYYMTVKNQQISIMANQYGYGRMMINAGRTESYGAELAVQGRSFADKLTWNATYNYTHSTFEENAVTTVSPSEDIEGNRVPYIPMHAFSAVADYRFDIKNSGMLRSLTLGADVTGCGSIYWDMENLHKQKFYALLGAHARLDFGCVNVNVWGRNLTNTGYNTFLVNSAVDGVERSFSQRGTPVQIGIDVHLEL